MGGEGRQANRQQSHCQIAHPGTDGRGRTGLNYTGCCGQLVLIGETSAWPAQNEDLDSGQGADDADTDAAQVGFGGGVFVDPDAAANTAA